MKKMILMALISGVAVSTLAADKGWTKEEYLERRKDWANGQYKVNKDKVYAKFEELDTDENNRLTKEERTAGKKAAPKKAGKSSKKAGVSKKAKSSDKGWTEEEYLEKREAWAANDGAKFNKRRCVKRFAELDADCDGKVTQEERDAGKKKKSPKKDRKKSSRKIGGAKKATSGGKGWTKEEYLEKREDWASGQYKVNKDKVYARFVELDTDENGLLTKAERTAGKK